jgi:hypothetical protein
MLCVLLKQQAMNSIFGPGNVKPTFHSLRSGAASTLSHGRFADRKTPICHSESAKCVIWSEILR